MKLDPVSSNNKINYPELESEFEVQAFLFSELRRLGHDVRGEVTEFYHGDGRKQKCRFDLVIYKEKTAKAIIEVKARPVKHKTSAESTRQGKRYPTYGVDVYFVYGIQQANDFILSYKG